MPASRSRTRGRRPPRRAARRIPTPAKGPVSACRLRVPLPDSAWIAGFSRAHPGVRIEVRSRLDLGPRRSLSELRLQVPETGPWADKVRTLPGVEQVEPIASGPSEVHLRVIHRTSPFIPIFRELELMRRFPFTIQGGDASWVVVASESKVRELLLLLQERAPGVLLESVRPSEVDSDGAPLTPRQTELLRRAMATGYFDVPRKITLTRLAAREGMAVSSLSEALAIVEKKLLDRWPPGAPPSPPGRGSVDRKRSGSG